MRLQISPGPGGGVAASLGAIFCGHLRLCLDLYLIAIVSNYKTGLPIVLLHSEFQC
jgi:hypothetical protein